MSIIIFNNKEYVIENCKNWRILNGAPDCKLNLDLNKCNTCPSKIFRNGNYNDPQIVVFEKSEKFNNNIEKIKELKKEETKKDPSFKEKVKNYAKAETSQMFSGKVSDQIFEKRKQICLSCEFLTKEAKNITDEIGWCKGGCGCVVGNPRAALSQKLYMPTLSCPKGKFGIEKGTGFNVTDAVDSAKGIIKSVKNLFEKDK